LNDEGLFFELALEDLTRAADLFRPIYEATGGVDGFVSLEVSPLLAYDPVQTLAQAKTLLAMADRPNLFIKIPGIPQGLPAIEEAIYAGIPVNITLLFSREQYLAAVEAYLRGLERRLEEGLQPKVNSVASVFVSRWDRAVAKQVPNELQNHLGLAMMGRTYKAYRDWLGSSRWKHLEARGAIPQRLLWASTGMKDPAASDVLYVSMLAAPQTINTMPEATLLAFAEHGTIGKPLPQNGGDSEATLHLFAQLGIDLDALAEQLQHDGIKTFVQSWQELLGVITAKGTQLQPSVSS
jgi:transaldolase